MKENQVKMLSNQQVLVRATLKSVRSLPIMRPIQLWEDSLLSWKNCYYDYSN